MQCRDRKKIPGWKAAMWRGQTTATWTKEAEYITVQNEKIPAEEEDGVSM